MPRFISSMAFAGGAIALAASVYVWRARELSSLEHQLQTAGQGPPVAKEQPVSAQLLLQIKGMSAAASPEAKAKRLLEKLQSLTPGQLNEVCDAVLKESMPPAVQKAVFMALGAAALKRPHPEDLAILLKISKRQEDIRFVVEKTAAEWLQADPAGVAAWLGPHLTDGSMAHLRESFREQMKITAEYAPAMMDAATHFEKIRQAPEELRGSLLHAGMKHAKSSDDRRTIATAILTWPEDSLKNWVSEVMPIMAAADGFDETACWLNGLPNINAARGADARVMLVMGKGGNPDIAKKADAILKQTDAAAGAEFASQLISMWLSEDHRAAAEWINGHPGAAWQDMARQAFARGITTSEPTDAMTWAASISEPGLRSETTLHVFNRWKSKDAAAAKAFLEGSSVPDDLKELLQTGATPQ